MPRLAIVLLGILAATTVGCSPQLIYESVAPAGTFHASSLRDQPVVLSADFSNVFFSGDEYTEATFWLSTVSTDKILKGKVKNGQVIHVTVLWTPLPGMTPIDSSATNASIRYILFADGEVGVYEGGGFAMTVSPFWSSETRISLRDATLRLAVSTPGFRDLLSPAQLTGIASASNNARETRRFYYGTSQLVTDRLGIPWLVRAKSPAMGLKLALQKLAQQHMLPSLGPVNIQ